LVSSKWIESLFNYEMARLTPLDFRLSAAAQFRLLAHICFFSEQMITKSLELYLTTALVSSQVIANTSFNDQADAMIDKFYKEIKLQTEPSEAFKLVMLILFLSRIPSAMNIDAFTLGIPGLDQYTTIPNFYPLDDNATFSNVSLSDIDSDI
jgi:hypothetical protein